MDDILRQTTIELYMTDYTSWYRKRSLELSRGLLHVILSDMHGLRAGDSTEEHIN